ncbi:MAG TPA: DUF502 domain-containing protein [Marinagarivorans sp.]
MRPIINTFLKGLVFLLPLVVTFGLLYWLFIKAEDLLKIPLQWVLPEGAYVTGMGLVSAVVLIFLLGILVQTYITNHIFRLFGELMARTPLVRTLYTTARDFMELVAGNKEKSLQGVVVVTLDHDIRLMGFVTNDDVQLGDHDGLVAVYLPMSYQVGGYTLLVPPERCERINMPVKKAMQQVLTAHVTRSHEPDRKAPKPKPEL